MRLVAISADDIDDVLRMDALTCHQMRIVADFAGKSIDRFGLTATDDEVSHPIARPAVFVVDDNAVVRYTYVSRDASDRPKPALIFLAAESLLADQTSGKRAPIE
jgi:peroxiredoxin